MHEAFWNGLLDVRWEDAPLGPETTRLVLRLRECGYAERTCRDYGHAVIHLGRVLSEEAGGVEGVRDDAVIEDFPGRHLPVCCCYRRPAGRQQERVRRGLAHLRAMLREDGVIPAVEPDEPPYQELIEGYCRFLRRDRGLAETTVVNYRRYLRDFLASRGDAVSPAELVALTAEDLLVFSRRRGARLGRTAWNHLADVPCALSWEQVQRLLAVAGRDAPGGRCNYAMLLLIASYGLRGCEARALRLSDIDWVHDEITIFASKTGRRRRLPLTRPVGEAILDYLLADRPPSPHEEVFLSSRPPHGPLRSKMNPWLGRQLDEAGIVTPRRGAHILRHSLAVHLLRSGETLKSIGDVLGHRHPDTTFIYTKLHVEDLRTVALEPGVVS